jgi:hypothetical protein
MKRIERVLIGPRELRVGNGPGYLIFCDNGNVYSYREGPDAVGPVATKGLGAYKDGRLRQEVAVLALVPALDYEPKRSRDQEFVRLKNIVTAIMPIIDRLKDIQTIGSKETAERLIDELARDVKSARKLNYSDLVLNHPIDIGKKVAKGVYPHDHFVHAVVRLAKTKFERLKLTVRRIFDEEGAIEKLCPTKGEVTDEFQTTQSHTTKLCKANGYAWLPTNRPGPT